MLNMAEPLLPKNMGTIPGFAFWRLPPVAVVKKQRVLDQLDPETSAQLFALLMGLVLAGIVLMAVAWLGARVVRRYAKMNSRESSFTKATHTEDDWWQKPMVSLGDEDPLE